MFIFISHFIPTVFFFFFENASIFRTDESALCDHGFHKANTTPSPLLELSIQHPDCRCFQKKKWPSLMIASNSIWYYRKKASIQAGLLFLLLWQCSEYFVFMKSNVWMEERNYYSTVCFTTSVQRIFKVTDNWEMDEQRSNKKGELFRFTTKSSISECEFMALLLLLSS